VHTLITKLPEVNNNYYVFYLFAYCVLKRDNIQTLVNELIRQSCII
jgi:hypothetical protein